MVARDVCESLSLASGRRCSAAYICTIQSGVDDVAENKNNKKKPKNKWKVKKIK